MNQWRKSFFPSSPGAITVFLTREIYISIDINLSSTDFSDRLLVPVICQARAQLGKRALETLARSHRTELRHQEVAEIAEAIVDARAEYVALLQNWIVQHLPSQTSIDEFIVSGGTARYLKKELSQLLKGLGGSINWCASLEERILRTFGERVSTHSLESRLADVYGLFYKLVNRPLPRLRKTTGESLNDHLRAS